MNTPSTKQLITENQRQLNRLALLLARGTAYNSLLRAKMAAWENQNQELRGAFLEAQEEYLSACQRVENA